MEEGEADRVSATSQPKRVLNRTGSYKCQVCGDRFDRTWDLMQHLWIHTGDKPFRCDRCTSCFHDLANLHQHQREKHQREKHNVIRFQCDQCFSSYKNNKDLRKHRRLKHQEVKDEGEEITVTLTEEPQINNSTINSSSHWTYKGLDYECSYCGERFPNMTRLTIHERIHEGKEVQKCKYCGIEFLTIGNLRTHELTHKREPQIKCGHCGKRFTNLEKLKLHKCPQNKDRYTFLFMCSHCGIKFSSRNELTIHQLQYSHIGEKSPPKKQKRTSDTEKDYDSSHQSPEALLSVKQEETPAPTPSQDDAVKDMVKKYKCHYCEKCFKCNHHLKEHIYIHTGKPYKCNMCSIYFVRRNRLERHQCRATSHPKQRDFSVKFRKKSTFLARRQQFHNKKNYKCKQCVQTFASYNNLLVHNLTVHGKVTEEEEPHEPDDESSDKPSEHGCARCGESFMDPSSLSVHKCNDQSTEKTLTCQDCGTVVKVGETTLSNVFTVTNLSNVKCFINNHTLL